MFEPSTSPLVGREGDIVGARQLKERLMLERENNVTMKIEELEDKSGIEVSGRGILHLSVLMETMRREGFELQVGRPRVLFKKDENGNKIEPIEQAVVECPEEYSGKVIEIFGTAGGTMVSLDASGLVTHLEFKIPTRGIMGLKNRILNVTHGDGVFYHTFLEYGPYAGDIGGRKNGAMISMSTDKAVAYALGTLQERGTLFVAPGDACYEGMIVGESARPGDMVVNVAKTKNLGNQRSSTSDISVQLTPPRTFTLEEALEYITDDELVEITPQNVRMRKRLLSAVNRKKAAKKWGNSAGREVGGMVFESGGTMSKKLLMGNEAFAHAALEAGVRVVAGYPGTPSSELVETVAKLHAAGKAHGVHVEWSTNEKAALELLAGASYCGARTLFTCKQVGLNVASDALMSLNYVGIKGGCVLFVADDPGPISSQTEQDTRRFGAFSKVPILDPATPEQGFAMMKAAFDLSEKYRTPVIVRPTTRICHAFNVFRGGG